MEDMTKDEIDNFALNFCNLLKEKNSEIFELKAKTQRLNNELLQFRKPGKRLTVEEIREAQRPVFAQHIPCDERLPDFYAVPLRDNVGSLFRKTC